MKEKTESRVCQELDKIKSRLEDPAELREELGYYILLIRDSHILSVQIVDRHKRMQRRKRNENRK